MADSRHASQLQAELDLDSSRAWPHRHGYLRGVGRTWWHWWHGSLWEVQARKRLRRKRRHQGTTTVSEYKYVPVDKLATVKGTSQKWDAERKSSGFLRVRSGMALRHRRESWHETERG